MLRLKSNVTDTFWQNNCRFWQYFDLSIGQFIFDLKMDEIWPNNSIFWQNFDVWIRKFIWPKLQILTKLWHFLTCQKKFALLNRRERPWRTNFAHLSAAMLSTWGQAMYSKCSLLQLLNEPILLLFHGEMETKFKCKLWQLS